MTSHTLSMTLSSKWQFWPISKI